MAGIPKRARIICSLENWKRTFTYSRFVFNLRGCNPIRVFFVTGTPLRFFRDRYPSPFFLWLVPLCGFVVTGTPLRFFCDWYPSAVLS